MNVKNIDTSGMITRLYVYGAHDLCIDCVSSDQFHTQGKSYIECFDYFKENDYGFDENNHDEFIIEKTFRDDRISDVDILYLTGLNYLLKNCRPRIQETIKQINFYDDILLNLKNEAIKLNKKLTTIREGLGSVNSSQSRSNDMNLYISTLKSLRDTLDLISKYDWRLMYSEYETDSGCAIKKPLVKQIAVWEQNHENQIRKHKVWNVIETKDGEPLVSFDESGNLNLKGGKIIE